MKGKSQAKIHIEQIHSNVPVTMTTFTLHLKMEILQTGFYDTATRKLVEDDYIKRLKPTLNLNLL